MLLHGRVVEQVQSEIVDVFTNKHVVWEISVRGLPLITYAQRGRFGQLSL